MLLIGGDNAKLEDKFSFKKEFNRKGKHLHDFVQQNSLIVGNINFQKPTRNSRIGTPSVWTCTNRFLLIQKMLAQAYSTSNLPWEMTTVSFPQRLESVCAKPKVIKRLKLTSRPK